MLKKRSWLVGIILLGIAAAAFYIASSHSAYYSSTQNLPDGDTVYAQTIQTKLSEIDLEVKKAPEVNEPRSPHSLTIQVKNATNTQYKYHVAFDTSSSALHDSSRTEFIFGENYLPQDVRSGSTV